jgi:hypothetical protein
MGKFSSDRAVANYAEEVSADALHGRGQSLMWLLSSFGTSSLLAFPIIKKPLILLKFKYDWTTERERLV